MNNINKSVMVIAIMVICVSMVPRTANAGENKTLELNKDYIFTGEMSGYLFANTSDNITIHWKSGDLGIGSMMCFITPTNAFGWNMSQPELQTNLCGNGWHANPGGIWRYEEYMYSAASPPRNFWLIPSSTGFVYVVLYASDTNQHMVNFTIKPGHYYVDQNDINIQLNKLQYSIDQLNLTVSGLGNQDNIRNITKDIIKLKDEINNLTLLAGDSTKNITLLQKELYNITAEISKINTTIITNINVTQRVNLTKINESLNSLSAELVKLNKTIQNLNIPPDEQSDVSKLKAENALLIKQLSDLQKKVSVLDNTTHIIIKNNTIYNNNTTVKKITAQDNSAIGAASVGAISGIVSGGMAGIAVTTNRKKKKGQPIAGEFEDITNKEEYMKVESKPEVKSEPNKDENTIDEILGKLKPEDKKPLKPKTADSEVDEVPIKPIKDKPTQKVSINFKTYTESDILSRLTSLPRGLPNEFFGKDLSELANILVSAKYITKPNGDIIFTHRGKSYYGNPEDVGTYMQRYK